MAEDRNIVFKVIVDDKGAIVGLKSVTKGFQDVNLQGKNAKASVDQLTTSLKQVGGGATVNSIKLTKKELQGLQTSLGSTSAASGGAATSVLELGRAVSDAPYGIRGMANNVSQLASNMLFTSQQIDAATGKAVGFGGVLKAMGKSMMGPLGILLAIQTVISAVDYLYGGMKKAEDATGDWGDSISELNDILRDLYTATEDVNGKIDEYINLTLKKIEIDGTLKKNAEELKDIQEDINLYTDYYNKVKKQRLDLEARGITTGEAYNRVLNQENAYQKTLNGYIEDRYTLIKNALALTEALRKQEEDYKKAKSGTLRALLDEKSELEKQQKTLSETSKAYNAFAVDIAKVQAKIDAITGGKKKKVGKSRKDLLTENIFSLEQEESDYQKRRESALEWNENKLLRIKQEYEQVDLKLKYEAYVDKEQARIEANNKELAAKKISDSEWLANDKLLKGELTKAEQEYYDAAQILADTQGEERKRRAIDIATKEFLAVEAARRGGTEQSGGFAVANDSGVDAVLGDMALEQTKFDNKMFFIEQEIIARKLAGETFADLTAEQANVENQHEQDKFQLKRRLEASKLEIVNQGLQFAIQVAGEGSAVGKAAAVAMATISTYEAATAALGAKPYGPWNIAQAAIVTAMGIANVQKIISTKIPSGGGSSAGSVPSGRTFDFNLAGSTGQNQLAQTIGGQVQQTIKAYVVASEITNQQAFDNQIQGQVTIG
jgi:hypothetical protein